MHPGSINPVSYTQLDVYKRQLERRNGVVDDLFDGRALRGAQLVEDALGDVRGTRERPVVLGGLVLPPVILALAAPMADAGEVIFLPVARRIDDVALIIQVVDGQYERCLLYTSRCV